VNDNIVSIALDRFERLLRFGFPGLMFWGLMPFAITSMPDGTDLTVAYNKIYSNVNTFGHLAIILTSGLAIYIIERYLVH